MEQEQQAKFFSKGRLRARMMVGDVNAGPPVGDEVLDWYFGTCARRWRPCLTHPNMPEVTVRIHNERLVPSQWKISSISS